MMPPDWVLIAVGTTAMVLSSLKISSILRAWRKSRRPCQCLTCRFMALHPEFEGVAIRVQFGNRFIGIIGPPKVMKAWGQFLADEGKIDPELAQASARLLDGIRDNITLRN